MRDTIYRDEAIEAVLKNAGAVVLYNSDNTGVLDILNAIPSAEDVIREGYSETDGVIEIEKQSEKDVGEIKCIVIRSPNYTRYFYNKSMPIPAEPQTGELISRAEPTVIRSRTFMPTKDFKEWAERIREVNPNAVVIPCDAEVVSAEAEEHRIYKDGYNTGKAHASADAVQGWIPFTRRPMTEEEQKDYPNCTFMFDCVLPDDGDEILVSNGRFVWMDTFCSDIDRCYLDSGDDIDEDMAWMPLPTPYKGGDSE